MSAWAAGERDRENGGRGSCSSFHRAGHPDSIPAAAFAIHNAYRPNPSTPYVYNKPPTSSTRPTASSRGRRRTSTARRTSTWRRAARARTACGERSFSHWGHVPPVVRALLVIGTWQRGEGCSTHRERSARVLAPAPPGTDQHQPNARRHAATRPEQSANPPTASSRTAAPTPSSTSSTSP